jgi:RHS repeat-associated protein
LAEVIQERHYYPFGMEMSELSYGTGSNKYLYNSKEIQNDFDLYWYDYGARFYDPELARFHSVDPLSENYFFQSPYAYAANNPILFIDRNGEGPGWGPYYEPLTWSQTKKVATFTDVNDAVVLGTTITRGKNAINIDGTRADNFDKAGAVFGVFAPFVSGKIISKGLKRLFNEANKLSNPVPNRLARVRNSAFEDIETLGRPGAEDVFVTGADDLKGIKNSKEIAKRLTLLDKNGKLLEGPYQIIEFDTPAEGIASPVFRQDYGFAGKGKTKGGAKEFTIPNKRIDELENVIKKNYE